VLKFLTTNSVTSAVCSVSSCTQYNCLIKALSYNDSAGRILNCMAVLMIICRILRGPGGERNMVFVPGGTVLELQVKTGSWAGRTNPQ